MIFLKLIGQGRRGIKYLNKLGARPAYVPNVRVMSEEQLLKISTSVGLLFQSANQLPNSSSNRAGNQS
jgi:hypothetical protein